MTAHAPGGFAGRILKSLGVRPEERGLAGWMTAVFLVTQSTHAFGANAADTLFFLRFGVEELPTMIALSGLVVMAMVAVHGTGIASLGARRWMPLIIGATTAWVFVAWAGVFLDTSIVYPIIWVSTQGVIMLTLAVMWSAAGAVCNTRQAKRLFPLFATAGVVGGVLGNLATGPIASIAGAQTLLLVQGGFLAASTALLIRAGRYVIEDESDGPGSVVGELRQAVLAVRSSRLLRLAAVVAFSFSVLFYMVVFPFSEAVATSFPTEEEVAGFLGLFSSVATASTFLVALLLAKRLFSRIGIIMSLLIVPVVYAAGFALWLGEFSLAPAAVVRGLQWVVVNAIGLTAFAAVFNVLTGRRRAQVSSFMTAVPAQLGTVAGGLILVGAATMSNTVEFGIGLAVALVTVGVVLAMRSAYVDAILTSVRHGVFGVFDVLHTGLVSPADGEARRILEGHLDAPQPEARAFALSALNRLDDGQVTSDLSEYLRDESPVVRTTAFDLICDLDPGGFSSYAGLALDDENPEMRLRALHYATTFEADDWHERALAALDDADPRVRAAAAVMVRGDAGEAVAADLVRSSDPAVLRALLAEIAISGETLGVDLASFLDHEDAGVRAAAASAHAAAGLDPEPLRVLLDDPSIQVRRSGARALAGSDIGRQVLLEMLESGNVRETDAALDALTPFEDPSEDFTDWARGEAERAAYLDELRWAIAQEPGSEVGEFLVKVLELRAGRLEQWVLSAMTTADTEQIMPVVQRGVVSDDVETRAQALEALEAIGDRGVMEVLLPLLDDPSTGPQLSAREALRSLSTDFDPWLRALAIRCLAEAIRSDLEHVYEIAGSDGSDLVREVVPSLAAMPLEKTDTLGIMDRVLALQRVKMFSGLDPEELELLARSTSEIAYEPGELVYSEGDKGDEALMIVSGSVDVSITRNGQTKLINTYKQGDCVGELALLSSGVRSADVVAGQDGVHGVVITKADFMTTLEERPSVALGMLATLAERLVQET